MDQFMIPADRSADLVGQIGFQPAFELTLEFDRSRVEETPHGKRIFNLIRGGTISGKIEGTVYPQGAGEYSLQRDDGVIDVNGHVILRDNGGEWMYLRNIGYARPDGYRRLTSWVDTDVRSEHNWVLGLLFVGIATPIEGNGMKIRYFEVL